MRTPVLALLLLAGCRPPCPPLHTEGGLEPYGAGTFSTDAWDFFMAFSPDESRVLFGRADDAFEQYELLETRRTAAGWSPPRRPRFAEAWSNADPHIAPDGQRVFFISNRPDPPERDPRASYDIFVATLGPDGEWGDAVRLPPPVNDPTRDEWSPAVAASGNLYFGADRPGTRGGSDLWVARLEDGAYQEPENLGDAINTAAHELEPWIAPDESYLILSGLRRPDGVGGYDLFVSRRSPGGWTPARAMPSPINTRASDYNQSVSPDGRWLYFASTRGARGTGDIYRVPLELGE